jgi:hypothetical protein
LRLAAAVPRLVTLLHDDEDGLNEDTIEALVRIGTAEVIAQLDRRYLTADRNFCRCAVAVLENIHADRSIATLRFWYKHEADTAVRHRILRALVCGFVPDAVEPARQALSADPPTLDFTHLRIELVAFCTLTGISFPELETWQEEARRDYSGETSGSDEEHEWDEERWGVEEGWDEEGEGDDAPLLGLGPDHDEPDEPSGRIVNTDPRIGRNEPCPCGSGKKYKKCCLRKK